MERTQTQTEGLKLACRCRRKLLPRGATSLPRSTSGAAHIIGGRNRQPESGEVWYSQSRLSQSALIPFAAEKDDARVTDASVDRGT
ncbi:MAG: hypothetical protein ACTTKL_06825 [Treponema sp.]